MRQRLLLRRLLRLRLRLVLRRRRARYENDRSRRTPAVASACACKRHKLRVFFFQLLLACTSNECSTLPVEHGARVSVDGE